PDSCELFRISDPHERSPMESHRERNDAYSRRQYACGASYPSRPLAFPHVFKHQYLRNDHGLSHRNSVQAHLEFLASVYFVPKGKGRRDILGGWNSAQTSLLPKLEKFRRICELK